MTEDMNKRLEEIRERSDTCVYGDDIETASQDVHDLLSEIDKLKEENVKEKQAYVGMELGFKEQTKKVKKLEAENKELKEELSKENDKTFDKDSIIKVEEDKE